MSEQETQTVDLFGGPLDGAILYCKPSRQYFRPVPAHFEAIGMTALEKPYVYYRMAPLLFVESSVRIALALGGET